jgi:hypothetical protein
MGELALRSLALLCSLADLVASQIHIFPEGKIKQDTLHELRRFKWGVSRMLMESKAGKGEEAPLIIPIWIKGQLVADCAPSRRLLIAFLPSSLPSSPTSAFPSASLCPPSTTHRL